MRSTSILALAILLAGCGDDPAAPDAGPPAVDQCIGASDIAIISASSPDGGAEALNDALSDCVETPAAPCYDLVFEPDMDAELAACLTTCTDGTPVAGLSAGCLACFSDATRCVTENCLIPCITGDPSCNPCISDHCHPGLFACTGF